MIDGKKVEDTLDHLETLRLQRLERGEENPHAPPAQAQDSNTQQAPPMSSPRVFRASTFERANAAMQPDRRPSPRLNEGLTASVATSSTTPSTPSTITTTLLRRLSLF